MKLYYKPRACSQAAHIILYELELKHSLEEVDVKEKRTKSGKDFNEINPKGYVPALELDNGVILTENFAVLTYLADLVPAKDIALQSSNGLESYYVAEWLSYAGTELHKNFTPFFYKAEGAWLDYGVQTLSKRLDYVEQHLADKEYLVADKFTIADAYLFVILGWLGVTPLELSQWPNLQAYRERIKERPSVQKAFKAEGISE
ncbi:glutathione transferase GstA [Brackiella oedipodis]|uniref:glutathione transferase GstA n=1 Tax=Brackiella oedipodis TaxID=124225 RepID=UPI00048E33D1|nr:glutathione transferase GstA [Brackiella oedipodis]